MKNVGALYETIEVSSIVCLQDKIQGIPTICIYLSLSLSLYRYIYVLPDIAYLQCMHLYIKDCMHAFPSFILRSVLSLFNFCATTAPFDSCLPLQNEFACFIK